MFNWVDAAIIVFIALFAVSGYFKGFIRQLADFVSLIVAFVLSVVFYNQLAGYIATRFSTPPNFAKAIAFLLIWVLVQFVINLVIHISYPKIPEKIRTSVFNKGAGALPGLLWGILFVAIVVNILVLGLSFLSGGQTYRDAILASKTGSYVIQKTSGLEKYVSNIFGGAINDTLTFLTVKPGSGETVNLGFKTTKVSVDEQSENEMLEKVNKERTSRGLKALVMDERLREIARAHSRDMFARGYFAHVNPDGKDPFDRMKDANIQFLVAGENLALAPNVDLAHEGLMNSPGHRANILTSEFGKVGIGCIDGGPYGKMFSQEFTN